MGAVAIREATIADVAILAKHRASMFRDMGKLPADAETELVRAAEAYLRDAMPRGEYLAWIANSSDTTHTVIGGAGVQLRPMTAVVSTSVWVSSRQTRCA